MRPLTLLLAVLVATVVVVVAAPSGAQGDDPSAPPATTSLEVPTMLVVVPPPRVIVTQAKFNRYVTKVYLRTKVSKRALRYIDLMRGHAATPEAEGNMWVYQRSRGRHRRRVVLPKARIASVGSQLSAQEQCIIRVESGGNPKASNGSHWGIGQWDGSTWIAHGGGRYAPTPLGASYDEQLAVLHSAYQRFGCSAWCPYEHGQCG